MGRLFYVLTEENKLAVVYKIRVIQKIRFNPWF